MNTLTLSPDEVARKAMQTPMQRKVDSLQRAFKDSPLKVEVAIAHNFAPGVYIRTMFPKAGELIISKIHKSTHPFLITRGRVAIWVEGSGWKVHSAPFSGITTPGTRRMIYVYEDCEWSIFIPTNKTDLDEIEKDVIYNPEVNDEEPTAQQIKLLKEAK